MHSKGKHHPSGFKCPVCEAFIPVSIKQLLLDERFLCPGCSLEIRLNRGDSHKALNALQKLHEAEEGVRKASVFSGL
jgi:rubredoxin